MLPSPRGFVASTSGTFFRPVTLSHSDQLSNIKAWYVCVSNKEITPEQNELVQEKLLDYYYKFGGDYSQDAKHYLFVGVTNSIFESASQTGLKFTLEAVWLSIQHEIRSICFSCGLDITMLKRLNTEDGYTFAKSHPDLLRRFLSFRSSMVSLSSTQRGKTVSTSEINLEADSSIAQGSARTSGMSGDERSSAEEGEQDSVIAGHPSGQEESHQVEDSDRQEKRSEDVKECLLAQKPSRGCCCNIL